MEFLKYMLLLIVFRYVRSDDSYLPAVSCSCKYHKGGCVISKAAPQGFKCQCRYKGAWTCRGITFPCVGEEKCPGNLADYCACKLGRGDCNAYKNHQKSCDFDEPPRYGVAGRANCDCNYHRGGCTIHRPAPYGWKCVCVYKGAWTCRGWAQQCDRNEVCLGNDFSFCGCKQGGGNCRGYIDKPSCQPTIISQTCDCNKHSDWSKGLYAIEEVIYDTSNMTIHSLQPEILAEKDIPNESDTIQTITLVVGKTVTRTSTFSHTVGISIQVGVSFKAGIPAIAEEKTDISISKNYDHTWGESESISTTIQGRFTCSGTAHKYTKCLVTMDKAQFAVPYRIKLRHKVIQDCVCESLGVWSGIQTFKAKLITREVENGAAQCYVSMTAMMMIMGIIVINCVKED